ncbi:Putative SOS response-associated peptidase YedK [Anatilimnocola aggregata]|uniref:Abasic site processing protein n=1 Tax=Anatilimnocola aggregata TaxID=2528021 RepID=A0A517YL82_9BACT|nr:SOS response-associated peptidase [Anatilimnocola aggregata]QDU30982.1 Putative SOS response-associated peptidase YedK [Anatilimnocola aggregata]
MCGRINQKTNLRLEVPDFLQGLEFPAEYVPRYNLAPSQPLLALRGTDQRELVLLRWGLIPAWAKDEKIAYSTINARADTVATKPAFRAAYKSRRCLVVADGYYEWLRQGKSKLPYLYNVDDRPFCLAGLWERWHELETCTVITTEANDLAAAVHDRMPVIVDPADYSAWLAGEPIPLVPFPSDRMKVRPVSLVVNNARNEGPQCEAPPATTLFE